MAHALMHAASRLDGTRGAEPLNLRVLAGHPDESGCGAHECARHLVFPLVGMLRNLWGRLSACGPAQGTPNRPADQPAQAAQAG